MENNELIERYIYAATKRLPSKSRKDVADELRTLIDDMLTERCGDETPTEKDVRIVLTELGTPQELAEKYNPDEKNCLIGPPYFTTYKMVLKIALICAGCGMLLAFLLKNLVNGFPDGAAALAEIMQEIYAIFTVLLSAFAYVTIIFAIFQIKGVKLDKTGNLDELPPVPKKTLAIHPAECIVSISFCIVITAIFLLCPTIFSVIHFDGDVTEYIPIFNTTALRELAPFILVFAAAGITRDAVKLYERRYSTLVLVSTIGTNLIALLAAVCWIRPRLFSTDFTAFITGTLSEDAVGVVLPIFDNFSQFWLAVIALALALDTIETVIKAIKTKREA